MRLVNTSKNNCLANNVLVADSFFLRLKGLLGKKQLDPEIALVIKPGNSIHTFFMQFDIDVLFLDKQFNVIAILEQLKPFRVSPIFFKSSIVVELAPGKAKALNVSLGDNLQLTS